MSLRHLARDAQPVVLTSPWTDEDCALLRVWEEHGALMLPHGGALDAVRVDTSCSDSGSFSGAIGVLPAEFTRTLVELPFFALWLQAMNATERPCSSSGRPSPRCCEVMPRRSHCTRRGCSSTCASCPSMGLVHRIHVYRARFRC